MVRALPVTLSIYCPRCNCTRAVKPQRRVQKRKNGVRANIVEVFCKHCGDRVQYGLPSNVSNDVPA